MRLHRFYTGPELQLNHDFWLHEERLLHQWRNVLRLKPGDEIVLFDGQSPDHLYKLVELSKTEAHLQLVTEFAPQPPKRQIYLLWSLIKKDKNDWVLQKATELGVSHFVPLLADRSEKIGFNVERAQRIVIEAAEQCGRGDIPTIREPMHPETAINELNGRMPLYVCEADGDEWAATTNNQVAVMVGPEGGWSDRELQFFSRQGIKRLRLHHFTLRAETAAITAVTKLVQ